MMPIQWQDLLQVVLSPLMLHETIVMIVSCLVVRPWIIQIRNIECFLIRVCEHLEQVLILYDDGILPICEIVLLHLVSILQQIDRHLWPLVMLLSLQGNMLLHEVIDHKRMELLPLFLVLHHLQP